VVAASVECSSVRVALAGRSRLRGCRRGQPAPDIAHLLKATDDYVRDVIHAFNDRGFVKPWV